MRADRLMNIMILLQTRGKMTAKELAKELEVSDRTILRDMDALSSAGIPIVSERGKEGGWQLLDTFRSKLSGLTLEDLKTLFIFPSGELFHDLGFNIKSLDTRQKLLAAVPENYRVEAQAVWERIHVDTSTWRQAKEKTNNLKIVQRAVFESKKLKINYEQFGGEQKIRLVEPLGLVAKGNVWYLVALRNGDIRNYRVSRIQFAEIENESFIRPIQFDLAAYWERSKVEFIQGLPEYEIIVEIDPAIVKRINFTSKFVQVIKIDRSKGDNWPIATLCFNDKQEAVEFVLGFANKIKVIKPKELSVEILSSAVSVVKLYEKQ